MRKKRLQHVADTLCHMFCGWRLVNCYAEMAKLGSGTVRIEPVSADCFFNGAAIPTLSIAKELELWMKEDLAANGILVDELLRVDLIAILTLSTVDWSSRSANTQFFEGAHSRVTNRDLHRCEIACTSEIATADKVYRGTYHDVEEWPIGWPAS